MITSEDYVKQAREYADATIPETLPPFRFEECHGFAQEAYLAGYMAALLSMHDIIDEKTTDSNKNVLCQSQ